MFAFGIWDEARQRLFLARDRLGKKPLYYSLRKGALSFASELKALAADPAFPRTLDSTAVSLYLRYGYVPAAVLDLLRRRESFRRRTSAVSEAGQFAVTRYWDPVAAALSPPEKMTEAEADDRLEKLLLDAVERRMIADVPLGAFLSGGIDSSLVVALMQEVGSVPGAHLHHPVREPRVRRVDPRRRRRETPRHGALRRDLRRCGDARASSSGCRRSSTSRSRTPRRSRRTCCRARLAGM